MIETTFHFHPGAVITRYGAESPPCPTPANCFVCTPPEPAPSSVSCIFTPNMGCDQCDDVQCICPDCVWIDEPLSIELAK